LYQNFQDNYVKANKPIILKGFAKNWPATQKWNFNFFANECANTEVVANLYNVKNTQKITFKDSLQYFCRSDEKNPFYIQEWWFAETNPELSKYFTTPEFFTNDFAKKLLGFYNNTLWVGQKGAYTPLHQDTTFVNIWTSQIMGKKEWVLIDKTAQMYKNNEGKPDYDRFYNEQGEKLMFCTLEAGDILYVPYKWWHRAQTLEDSISLNTFYITDEIVQRFLKDLLSLPFAVAMNRDLLNQYDQTRLNICNRRLELLSNLIGFNKNNILNIDTSGNTSKGIY